MIRRPSVRMMRQPPAYVPSESISAQTILTQTGMGSPSSSTPPMTRAITTMPIVFWAS